MLFLSKRSIPSAQPDIDKLLASNSLMSELLSRIVPEVVEGDEFWTRYFYRWSNTITERPMIQFNPSLISSL